MKKYFKQLDTDGSGSLSAAEIEETLISLGLARTRQDVEEIICEMDENGNGELEFGEFLIREAPKLTVRLCITR